MLSHVILGLIAMALAIAFFMVPVWKLKEIPLIVIVLIGVAMMVYEFIEGFRKKERRNDES
jgi:uncharacterized membrane protein